jgi:outer membrane OprD family porin
VLGQLNFNSAGETTAVVGVAYDFSHVISDGLKFQTRYGKGWNVIDASTGAPQSRQNEFNFEVEYQPMSGPFENLYVQLFYSGGRFPDDPPGQESQLPLLWP